MPRRTSDDTLTDLWELFTAAKWWASPVTAAATFVVFYWALPELLGTSPTLEGLAVFLNSIAPWVSSVILAIGFAALAQRGLAAALLDRQTGTDSIRSLSWRQFEVLIGAAYRRLGYSVINTGGNGADGGVDLVLQKGGERAIVQCKHWKSTRVGVKPVRELYGVAQSKGFIGSKAVFITSGSYTAEAVRFARDNGIELVGGSVLVRMLRDAQKDPVITVADPAEPVCPRCGSTMVLRTARKGDRAGKKFWGCSAYPSCRGIVDC